MSVFTPFRNPRVATVVFVAGAAVKLSEQLAQAQQAQRVNIGQIAGQNVVYMPYVCDNSTGVQSTVININTTQVQVVAGSTRAVVVCGFNVTTPDSSIAFKFVQGTSTDCITGQADLTGLYNFSSKSGMVVANGGHVQFKTSSGNSLCIDASSTGLTGMLTFTTST